MTKLSDTQLVVLSAACQRPDRSVYPLAVKLPGGASAKVLGSLLSKGLIKEVQAKREDTAWREDKKRGRLTLRATPAAFEALNIEFAQVSGEDETDAAEPKPGTKKRKRERKGKDGSAGRAARANSKQARLIAMLQAPEGATIEEIVKKFDWQAHTVRGAIAGALKKKLGLDVQSEKIQGRGRVYRIPS